MTYQSVVLADSPIRYYRLNDASGTVAHDSGSQATDGTYSNGPTLGQASLLAGTSDTEVLFTAGGFQHVDIPTTGLPTGASPWTIEVWASINSPVAVSGTAMALGTFNVGTLIEIETRTGSPAKWRFSNYGQSADFDTAGSFAYGAMHHLVATYDGTTIAYYIDGASVSSATVTMNITYGQCWLGTGDSDYNGVLAQAAIYSSALSSARILAHYNAGITAPGGIVTPKIQGNHRSFARVG